MRTPSLVPSTSLRPTASRRIAHGARAGRRPASIHPATIVRRVPRVGRELPANAAELFEQYRPIVQKIAGGFQRRLPRHVLREDLVAAGMAGLWDAIRKHGDGADRDETVHARVQTRRLRVEHDEAHRLDRGVVGPGSFETGAVAADE